jgi:hypothetical protein
VNVFHFEGSYLSAAVKEEWLAMAAILSQSSQQFIYQSHVCAVSYMEAS